MSLKEFMIGLATNTEVKRNYAQDPQAAMHAAGLTVEEQAAFSSGDSSKVRAALGKPDNDCMSQTGALIPAGSEITLARNGGVVHVTKNSILLSTADCLTDPLQEVVKKAKKKAASQRAAKRRRAAKPGPQRKVGSKR